MLYFYKAKLREVKAIMIVNNDVALDRDVNSGILVGM